MHIKAQNSKLVSNIKVYMLFILYKIILDLVYIYYISPSFSYSGMIFDFNKDKYLLTWLYLLLIAFLVPKSKEKVSYMVLQLHAVTMVIPMLTIYALANKESDFMLMVMICYILEIIVLKKNKLFLKIPHIINGKYIFIVLISLSTIITYVSLIYANGIHLEAIDFSKIYPIRERLIYPFDFLVYLASWQYRIINPYMIISLYLMNKKGMSLLFISLQLLLYFVMPFKEILFSVVLMIGLSLFLEKYNFLKSALSVISVAIIGAVNIAKISIIPLSVVAMRLLFVPALIKFQHFKVFSTFLDKLYFSEGLIGKMLGLNYPYSQSSGYIVDSFFGKGTSNSNTGYLAYAYDNMGFTGMIIITLLFIFIMLIIDSLSVKLNKNFVFALIIYQIFILNDGDLFTMLLTGGLFLSIIILLLDQESFKYERINKRISQNKSISYID